MSLTSQQEQDLVERARSDPEAFRALYQAYFPRVYAYIAYRVGRSWDAEDLSAEVFTRVVEALERFEYRGPGSFTAWIFTIARNQISQFYRINKMQEVPLDALPDMQSDLPTPDYAMIQKEKFARLHALIGTLSRRRQEVVTLRFFGGLRNQEIAEVLNLDERTVASHLCRALEDLESRYTNHEMDVKEHQ